MFALVCNDIKLNYVYTAPLDVYNFSYMMTTKSLIPSPTNMLSYRRLRKELFRVQGIHPDTNKISVEHAIPQSHYAGTIRDYHNLFVLPIQYNQLRSNYKLVHTLEHPDRRVHDWSVYHAHRLCSPSEVYRGVYARCCAYALAVYPDISNVLIRRVIEPHILLRWHTTYPATEEEMSKSRAGCDIQGNSNLVVDDAECLLWILQHYAFI